MNASTTTTAAPAAQLRNPLLRVVDELFVVDALVHAAWLAVQGIDREEFGAEREALANLLHIIGGHVNDATKAAKQARGEA